MPSYGMRTETQQIDGVTVYGEAVRRIPPDRAEFFVEITSTASSMTQVLRESQLKAAQISQALTPLGVQPGDVQTASFKVQNIFTPMVPALPAYGGLPQIGPGGYTPFMAGMGFASDVQVGSFSARNVLRISVREPGRAGEIADTAIRAGAVVFGGLNFRAVDETGARRGALEAAAKDARQKAEGIATAAGKQLGDVLSVTEEILVNDGAYSAMRAAMALNPISGIAEYVGELEYYARVSATFRIQ